jgi:hypothetical protein
MKVIFCHFFFLILPVLFYFKGMPNSPQYLEKYAAFSPFYWSGIECNKLVQVPFWTGWNLYLMNENYILVAKRLKLYYIAGTW